MAQNHELPPLPPYEAPTGEVEPEVRYENPWALHYPELASEREEN